ncbi:1-(5-phosphoribosyl)-5-[(5-phosphoribosylamino)methylideneamino] imidazole-4-carboxamide isomerase [bioreactor metagenome]|uniref:1-(5-phosphoribosyl)-5-[(5-phosphoribosylamino)methylideneamino] imidazole-4-carboxamide isomerase n=1 Tax=bioreactor metagenome TaxID=1076179 RepID=A0A644T792_9ZZZZ|nr:HisA/HisF family protein [Methanobrevibacter sp.]MEA4957282.1 HisA/HisF family protein [Methanobrevibacter sp.]
MIEIIPVLDLMSFTAVSGKSGNRDSYTPLKTIFASDSEPISITNNLKLNGAKQLYIADLDLIEKKGHNLDKIKMLNTILPVMLDSGIKDIKSFDFYLDYATKLIVATETLESIEELYKIFDKYPKERIVVSIDIKNNNILSKNFEIGLNEFKKNLIEINPNEIILLDISSVGTEKGFNKTLLNNFSYFKDKLIIGGGINKKEIHELENLGIKKALVGSALHNGDIKII